MNVGRFGSFLASAGLGTTGDPFFGPVSPPMYLSRDRRTPNRTMCVPFLGFGPLLKSRSPLKVDRIWGLPPIYFLRRGVYYDPRQARAYNWLSWRSSRPPDPPDLAPQAPRGNPTWGQSGRRPPRSFWRLRRQGRGVWGAGAPQASQF